MKSYATTIKVCRCVDARDVGQKTGRLAGSIQFYELIQCSALFEHFQAFF